MDEKGKIINRRGFLKSAGSALAYASLAGLGLNSSEALAARSDDLEMYDFIMPRVKFTCDNQVVDQWNILPGGDKNLLISLKSVVRCKVKLCDDVENDTPQFGRKRHFNTVVHFNDLARLRQYPFLFMTASCSYALSLSEKTNLKSYIMGGGFLLMDDCVASSENECSCKKATVSDMFFKSSLKMLSEVFGEDSIGQVPLDHEVFRNVYDLSDTGLPVVQGRNNALIGVNVGDRLAVLLSGGDIHCGWTDSLKPNDEKTKPNSKKAVEMGVNIIMYAVSH